MQNKKVFEFACQGVKESKAEVIYFCNEGNGYSFLQGVFSLPHP
jgi:hypothetical protein